MGGGTFYAGIAAESIFWNGDRSYYYSKGACLIIISYLSAIVSAAASVTARLATLLSRRSIRKITRSTIRMARRPAGRILHEAEAQIHTLANSAERILAHIACEGDEVIQGRIYATKKSYTTLSRPRTSTTSHFLLSAQNFFQIHKPKSTLFTQTRKGRRTRNQGGNLLAKNLHKFPFYRFEEYGRAIAKTSGQAH